MWQQLWQTQLKHVNIHYSLLKSNQASLKTFKSVECRLKYSQNKLWILKKYIWKVGQIKYKKRNVQNVSTFTNIQKQYYSILMTLQYNDNWDFYPAMYNWSSIIPLHNAMTQAT